MSETLSQDPEALGSGYSLAPNYPPTPATPSSTVQDPPGSNLPPFSTFSNEMDTTGFATDRFLGDTRLLDISNWDYYTETRLLDRTENGHLIITSQPQYRPWESKPVDSTSQHGFGPATVIADTLTQNGPSKLPSFQSQFQSYNEPATTSDQPTLTTLTNLTPLSPSSSSPTLTTLNSNFHTLSAVNPRNYPLVPAPIQAREIPSIQQQFLDERHIQLYTHPTNITTLNTGGIFQPQNGTALIQNSQLLGSPTVVTVIKSEPELKLTSNLATLVPQDTGLKIQNLHPNHFQNPMPTMLDNGIYNGLDKKLNGIDATANSPTRNDFRKKERRKIRASSLESSAESDGASSNMDLGVENSGQVAAVSSTANFKAHHAMQNSALDVDMDMGGVHEGKQVKKKRKRCGECIGCQRKDNCGDCAPCRNDKSHQICKQRRCEKLTEKKNLYGDQSFIRGESRRGRGKGRGSGSYRGRKPASVALSNTSVPESSVPASRPSPQPVHMLKPEQAVQQQPMAPMPFYADPTRFTTPVWQAETTQTWPQGQFIQQIPPPAQPAVPTLEPYGQQYPNGLYQTTYQQPGFETNTFYTGAVQVLTNPRPPSATEHPQLTPRTNGSYSHTPSPVPQTPQQPSTPRSNISGQYQEYMSNQSYVAPSTPTGGAMDNQSRPSSVNSVVNAPQQSNTQNFQSNGTTSCYSPSSNANPIYVNASSGNEKPGYTQVSSSPQLASHNSSGYPGNQFSGDTQSIQHQTQEWPLGAENMMWEPHIQQHHSQDPGKMHSQTDHEQSENLNDHYSSAQANNRVELNSRIKTMILNKQITGERKVGEEAQMGDTENKSTGHFLWYSHHRHLPYIMDDGGGVPYLGNQIPGNYLPPNVTPNRLTTHRLLVKNYSPTNMAYSIPHLQHEQYGFPQHNQYQNSYQGGHQHQQHFNQVQQQSNINHLQQSVQPVQQRNKSEDDSTKIEIPMCNCFPSGQLPPEPGSYYTHLGCSNSLINLRKDFETRAGVHGKAIRIEKVRYTGKEGKTPQGCPLAKWIIRRSNYEEKYLIVVKHRQGHVCKSAFIIVCIVAWEGVTQADADGLYATLTEKLNKFGLPTTRRCATNGQRNCGCQGLDPKTCGASFSFGCSWSMYYNGCKFAKSKNARKFRLTEETEEQHVEMKLQQLSTSLTPLYKTVAPESFKNQCVHEQNASDCRLGSQEGKPFSGVTACVDFCAHAHKDTHNMMNGLTAVVTLTKERSIAKPEDEQLHVLPLYTIDSTDEFGSKEDQEIKYKNGSVEILNKYQCEVRMRTVPLQPCRRRKKKDDDNPNTPVKKDNTSRSSSSSSGYVSSFSETQQHENDRVLQSNYVSSSRLDSPIVPMAKAPVLFIPNNAITALNIAYPKNETFNRFDVINHQAQSNFSHKVQDSSGIRSSHSVINSTNTTAYNIIDYSTGILNTTNRNNSSIYNGHLFSTSTPIKANPYPIKLPTSPIPHIHPSYNHHQPAHSPLVNINSSQNYHHPFMYSPKPLPPIHYFNNNQNINPNTHHHHYHHQDHNYHHPITWDQVSEVQQQPQQPETLGKVVDVIDNLESFADLEVGGVAIALTHGSVLFECAKHEMHATTALKKPNRLSPTRISLVFYQHRNLNQPKHGRDRWEEKTRLKQRQSLAEVGLLGL
nr:DNA N6-methyl adenine demethylase isoform X1 [Onthophagus taurus]